jgi:hypothetical protein
MGVFEGKQSARPIKSTFQHIRCLGQDIKGTSSIENFKADFVASSKLSISAQLTPYDPHIKLIRRFTKIATGQDNGIMLQAPTFVQTLVDYFIYVDSLAINHTTIQVFNACFPR